jgi:hypothetical protein
VPTARRKRKNLLFAKNAVQKNKNYFAKECWQEKNLASVLNAVPKDAPQVEVFAKSAH